MDLILTIQQDDTLSDQSSNFNIMIIKEQVVPSDKFDDKILNKLVNNHLLDVLYIFIKDFLLPSVVNCDIILGNDLTDFHCVRKEETRIIDINARSQSELYELFGKRLPDTNLHGITKGFDKENKILYTHYFRYGKFHRTDGPALITSSEKKWFINDKIHRLDGPAIIYAHCYQDGNHYDNTIWYFNDKLHRDNEAAVNIKSTKRWCCHGKSHREDDLPAIKSDNSFEKWFLYDIAHRVNAPAIEYNDGNREWIVNGKKHRIDGPAVIKRNMTYGSDEFEYWLDGIKYPFREDYNKELIRLGLTPYDPYTLNSLQNSPLGCVIS